MKEETRQAFADAKRAIDTYGPQIKSHIDEMSGTLDEIRKHLDKISGDVDAVKPTKEQRTYARACMSVGAMALSMRNKRKRKKERRRRKKGFDT